MSVVSDATVACCSRCGARSHRAASCPKPFFRPECRGCGRLGHAELLCPQKQRAEAAARRAAREADMEAWEAKQAAWKAKQAAWEARQAARIAHVGSKDIDALSDSAASASTAASAAEPLALPTLSVPEEKEARKVERKLREVAQLEDRLARGENLDALQLGKVARKAELEDTLVMQKLRAGYGRRADISAAC